MAATERGLKSRIIEAYSPIGNHFAVNFDGLIVDPTARQFDSLAEFPWIATRAEWEWACLTWIGVTGFRTIAGHPITPEPHRVSGRAQVPGQ
jgi:hypothetical protein